MTNGITIETKTPAGTPEALAAAIDARSAALKTTTEDSMVAAAITILRSLKASTATASTRKVPAGAYTVTKTNLIGCVTDKWGKSIGCHVKGDHAVSGIRPAIGYAPGSVKPWHASVYAITPTNPNVSFKKSVNTPARCWYVLCADEGQARNWADRRFVGRNGNFRGILIKESGMAKVALAMAQARASTRSRIITKSEFVNRGEMSNRAASLAYDAGELTVVSQGTGSGSVGVTFYDALRYSGPAAGGDTAVEDAMAKAVNSMMGAYGSAEIKAALEDLKVTNPEAKFIDVLRSRMS